MIKVKQFENYEAMATYYKEDHVPEEMLLILSNDHGMVKSDLTTECKAMKTAIKRFFKQINHIAEYAGWEECILENCECENYHDQEMANGKPTGGYSWGIESVNDNTWYIWLNVKR